jgi:non-ribosomal peptide synthetase component E (peptide arylation enzyme)
LSLDDLREHFSQSGVATFKFPEFLEVVDALPLTNVGKVDKALLRETYSVKGQ